jgi:3-hydroxyisobutyrate dehydrogenase-like beta-hydroxyacid dehydrogenase
MNETGSAMNVGLIGLGRMGRGMAGRLLGAGHQLAVYNRTRAKADAMGEAGAKVVGSIAELARHGDVTITMLADDPALEAVALHPGGLVESLPKGAIHMVMGTHGVDVVRRIGASHAEAGQILVAAPVLGRPDLAASGQLGIVVAGPAAAVDRLRPLLAAMGRRSFEAGTDPVAATSIKVTNNFVLGCAIEAMGEAFSLVRKYGVAPEIFYEVMTDGLFSAPAYKTYGKIIVEQSYDRVGQKALLGLKDANLALAAGEAVGVPLPSCNVWRDRLVGAAAHGDGDKDWAVMALEQARASGLA